MLMLVNRTATLIKHSTVHLKQVEYDDGLFRQMEVFVESFKQSNYV